MAKLINCKTCKKEMASNIPNCPHCGAKTPTSWTQIFIVSIVGFFIFSYFINSSPSTPKTERPKADLPKSNITYLEIDNQAKQLSEQNFESWAAQQEGKRVEWTGYVTDVEETISGDCEVRIDMNKNDMSDASVTTNCESTKPFNKKSKITVDGKITDIITILGFPHVSFDDGATLYHYK